MECHDLLKWIPNPAIIWKRYWAFLMDFNPSALSRMMMNEDRHIPRHSSSPLLYSSWGTESFMILILWSVSPFRISVGCIITLVGSFGTLSEYNSMLFKCMFFFRVPSSESFRIPVACRPRARAKLVDAPIGFINTFGIARLDGLVIY